MIEKERADNFLMAKEALNASIKGDGGAFDIETSMKAAAPFSLTEAEALHYCLTTKVLDHGCPSPARAALCSKKCLSIFSSICSD
ncbi:hypothetical protein AMTR_s00060p00157350 [Amborella trichopoda]|uniref:Uncharacterized protein n=1 Tax=Amborella trichopoda TaxID=13333 RepID=W1NL01_AMBTC|nr:hypothetical protein AMTR_s00060p00157350 [Amborella trichopoda]